jgi:protein TonB
MTRLQIAIVGVSLLAHLGVYAWMGRLPKERKTNAVAIALAESKKKKHQEDEKPPPPPPPPIQPAAKAKVATAAPKPAAVEPPPSQNTPPPPSAGDAPAAMDGFADLGLSMNGGGMALPAGAGNGSKGGGGAAKPAEPTTKKVKELAPAASDECKDDPVKPQLAGQVQPAYTAEGRQASIEGVVKLEIAVDENGRVTSVKVIKGLGFGLDEAAVTAAKQWTFKPATKCGKPISYVVKPGVRFQLGS